MTVKIPLTKGQFALVDDSDLDIIGHGKWQAMWCEDAKTFYAKQTYRDSEGRKRSRFMHRVIVGATDRSVQVDHRNQNGIDNRRANIRTCRQSANMANTRRRVGGTSRFKGVSFSRSRNRWIAQITKDGKATTIGRFKTEHEAAAAYNIAALRIHGEFAFLNSLPEVSDECGSKSPVSGAGNTAVEPAMAH